jgi:hypothetical protein
VRVNAWRSINPFSADVNNPNYKEITIIQFLSTFRMFFFGGLRRWLCAYRFSGSFGQPWKVVFSGMKLSVHCPFWEGNVAGEICEPYTKELDIRSSSQ